MKADKKQEKAILDQESKSQIGYSKVNPFKVGDFVIMLVIVLLCLTCIVPFVHIIAKSLSSNTAVLAKKVTIWPIGWNVDAYVNIFNDGQLTYAMIYTVFITILFTVIGMVVTVCAAYPLSKRRLKGRTLFSFLFMFTMYFSAGLIPEYLLMSDLNLINNMWVLILPLCFSPYNMLIMKSYFQSTIPDSLEEAAFLDGASNMQILWKIVLPLSKPILATLALFYAVGRWNAYADAKYYVRVRSLQPIQYILSNMILSSSPDSFSLSEGTSAQSTPEVLQSAAIMFATIPILCIYPFVQKHFVRGVMVGAVKG